jgi:hypothetical protein
MSSDSVEDFVDRLAGEDSLSDDLHGNDLHGNDLHGNDLHGNDLAPCNFAAKVSTANGPVPSRQLWS